MNLNELADGYNSELRKVFDKHAPLITRKKSLPKRDPWYTEDLYKFRRQMRAKERRFYKHRIEDDCKAFEKMRKVFLTRRFIMEKAYYNEQFENILGNQKKIFKTANTIMHRKNENPMPAHNSAEKLAEEFVSFFTHKIDKIRENFSDDDGDPFQFDLPFDGVPLTQFTTITCDDLKSIFSKLATKTCELDPLPTHLAKECFDVLSPIILRIVNLSLIAGCVPDEFKTAFVRPLLKKQNLAHEYKNYRPVSNLSFLSKVIEETVNRQLAKHIDTNMISEVFLSAYRPFCSTETALLKIFDEAFNHLDNRKAVLFALLDLSATFDTVDHSILLQRLSSSFSIRGSALRWFSSYLTGRLFRVVINQAFSNVLELMYSVPQGSILGPRLYTQYTKLVSNLIRLLLLAFHGYADDTQLWKAVCPHSTSEQQAVKEQLEQGIVAIADSLCKNKLKLNRYKTEFLVLASRHYQNLVDIDSLELGTDIVLRSESARNLGFIMDSSLSLVQQINDVRKKCFYYLN